MAKIRRIDFSPDEFLVGVADLKHDEIGPYWVACSLMYSQGGAIADDDAWIARACGCHVRTWRTIKARLIAVGKLVLRDGKLSNERCLKEIERAEGRLKKSREAADKSVEARRERAVNATASNDYNEIPEAPAPISDELSTNHQPSTTNDQRTVPPEAASRVTPPKAAAAADDGLGIPPYLQGPRAAMASREETEEAHRLWMPVAYELRIPEPGFLNVERRPVLAARLAECGGIEGWKLALEKLREAKFLRDDVDPSKPKHWVNLMTLCKPENFTGLMEGRYAERHEAQREPDRGAPTVADGVAAAFSRRFVQAGG